MVFRNETNKNLTIKKVVFFVNKVKIATRYKVIFFKVKESLPLHGNQYINNELMVFSTDTLLLVPGTKGEIKIDIAPGYNLPAGDKIFVSVQLINYLDESGAAFKPDPENDRYTKLKFQLSNKADYYAKFINSRTRELSMYMKNINLQINYDFAHIFFKKPHKSIIVAPAILLYAEKTY